MASWDTSVWLPVVDRRLVLSQSLSPWSHTSCEAGAVLPCTTPGLLQPAVSFCGTVCGLEQRGAGQCPMRSGLKHGHQIVCGSSRGSSSAKEESQRHQFARTNPSLLLLHPERWEPCSAQSRLCHLFGCAEVIGGQQLPPDPSGCSRNFFLGRGRTLKLLFPKPEADFSSSPWPCQEGHCRSYRLLHW